MPMIWKRPDRLLPSRGSSACRPLTNRLSLILSPDGAGPIGLTLSSASCDGGIYVGSSTAGPGAVNGAAPGPICKLIAWHGGADFGSGGVDYLGVHSGVRGAAGAHQVAVW